HTSATLAPGGFANFNDSIAGCNDFIQWVITLFMYLAGVNFILHFRALRGEIKNMLFNRELMFYNGVILVAVLLSIGVLYFNGLAPEEIARGQFRNVPMTEENFSVHYHTQGQFLESFYNTVRISFFQVISVVTTTGFVTVDFDLWPDFLRFMLIFLMFFGGCAGSTGGGIKMIRIMIVFKVALNILRKLTQPKLVAPIKVGDQVFDDDRVINIVSFFILFTGLFILTAFLMTIFIPDLTTAIACSIATIGNIGPGLAGVGAIENYGWIPLPGKWILVMSMLLGRLEIFTVLIVLRPAVWRK
ncbi:MAG: potassium transporter TrkG, partial [Candidatus Zixiibacteriota bacterium]